jgi:hypothetical protein
MSLLFSIQICCCDRIQALWSPGFAQQEKPLTPTESAIRCLLYFTRDVPSWGMMGVSCSYWGKGYVMGLGRNSLDRHFNLVTVIVINGE